MSKYKPITITLNPYQVAMIYEGLNKLMEQDQESAYDAARLKMDIEEEFKAQNQVG
jgi:hypothetical protein